MENLVGQRVNDGSFITAAIDFNFKNVTKKYRIVLIGYPKSGKKTLLKNWIKTMDKSIVDPNLNNDWTDHFKHSLSSLHFDLSFKIFDSAKDFETTQNSIVSEKQKPIDAIVMCYDMSDKKSFSVLDTEWKPVLTNLNFITPKGEATDTPICIIGCKSDLEQVIDTSLMKDIKPYLIEDTTTKINETTHENISESLNMIVESIVNKTKVENTDQKSKPKTLVDIKRGYSNLGNKPHSFKLEFFKKPTWCDFCACFIWGVHSKQGYECTECEFKCHKKCMNDVPHFCQKK